MTKPRNRHVFHFGVPGQSGTISIPVKVGLGRLRITLARSEDDVKKGKPGIAAACADALCAARHKHLFPHPIYYADFTRSRAYIVDKIDNGLPAHCVCYEHNDPTIPTFDNKRGGKRKLLDSGEAKREIVLSPPTFARDRPGRPRGANTGERKKIVSRGATGRAIDAGLIPKKLKKFAVG